MLILSSLYYARGIFFVHKPSVFVSAGLMQWGFPRIVFVPASEGDNLAINIDQPLTR